MTVTEVTGKPQSDTPKTAEERLQPWIDQGEYVIALTIVIMAWAAGWVDMFAFESDSTEVFGRYSVRFFALFVVYTAIFAFWFRVIASPRAIGQMRQMIAYIQRTPWLYVALWIGFAIIIWSMTAIHYWALLQLLQGAVMLLIGLFTLLVLLAKPSDDAPFQMWRKVALGLIGALLLFEGALQGLAYLNAYPVNNLSGLTVPHGRVYQDDEGFANGQTNGFGWYYPEPRLEDGTRRVILNGDSFIQALQIPTEAHMGVQLETLINADADNPTEVIAQGQPGYGATMVVNPIMYNYIWRQMEPDEIVVFFHLANDFQVNFDEQGAVPRAQVDEDGYPAIVEDDFALWHELAHKVVAGHDPIILTRTIASNSLVFNLVDRQVRGALGIEQWLPEIPQHVDGATANQPMGAASFVFATTPDDRAQQAYTIAEAQIRTFADEIRQERGSDVKLVTIPYFPQEFYTEQTTADWDTALGDYDLLLPEARLAEIAAENDIPFLGMGQYMRETGTTPADIQALYFENGSGHLTAAGHAHFAQALYNCFYSDINAADACVIP